MKNPMSTDLIDYDSDLAGLMAYLEAIISETRRYEVESPRLYRRMKLKKMESWHRVLKELNDV